MPERFNTSLHTATQDEKEKWLMLQAENLPHVQTARDNGVLHRAILDELEVQELLEDFNDTVLHTPSPVYEFYDYYYTFSKDDEGFPSTLKSAHVMSGLSLMWNSKNEDRMEVTEEGLLFPHYRLSIAIIDSSLYSVTLLEGKEKEEVQDDALYSQLQNDSLSSPVVINSNYESETSKDMKRFPIIMADNTFIPTLDTVDALKHWTQDSLYSIYFDQFTTRATRFTNTKALLKHKKTIFNSQLKQ